MPINWMSILFQLNVGLLQWENLEPAEQAEIIQITAAIKAELERSIKDRSMVFRTISSDKRAHEYNNTYFLNKPIL